MLHVTQQRNNMRFRKSPLFLSKNRFAKDCPLSLTKIMNPVRIDLTGSAQRRIKIVLGPKRPKLGLECARLQLIRSGRGF